jgi:predicted Zn-dependent protease
MNNLAALYLQHGRVKEANRLAALAVQLLPGEPPFLHTYAESLNALGEVEQAIQVMEKAAYLNPKYAEDLRLLRNQATKQ